MKTGEEIARTFSEKLRYYRKQSGLTQEDLGAAISYTGKAVSKWEQGTVVPPVEVLVAIADFFNISLDDLVGYYLPPVYYLGIDGGSSRTVFALANEAGEIIQTLTLGSSNPMDLGIEKAAEILDEGLKKITEGIPRRKISMFAGISGSATNDFRLQLKRFFDSYGFARAQNHGDIYNAMNVALPKSDGIVMRMGMSSCVLSKCKGEVKVIGGFGYLFEQGGSAYEIGNEAVKAAGMMEDGFGEKTVLLSYICKELGFESVRKQMPYFYTIGKGGIASLSAVVFKAYKEKQDKVARNILKRNMACAARMIVTASKNFEENKQKGIPIRVVLEGSLIKESEILKPMLLQEISRLDDLKYYDISEYAGETFYGALYGAGMPMKEDGKGN